MADKFLDLLGGSPDGKGSNGKAKDAPSSPASSGNKSPPSPDLSTRLSWVAKAILRSFSAIPETPYSTAGNTVDATATTGILEDLQKMGFKDVETLLEFLHTAVHGVQDDSKLLLERIVDLLSKLPPSSREGAALESGFIHQLWNSLQHPVLTTLDDKFKYREADGSNNNPYMPQLGAAGTPYARTTPPMTYQRPDAPEPSLLFDTLMRRGDGFQEHPNRISSVLFYMATLITHDIFQSDGKRSGINLTSSYLDLAPLYGRNKEEQLAVRALEAGRLKPDSFSSKRVHGFPPGVGVLIIMFNRFHNYVVTQLAAINEGGRFKKEPTAQELKGKDAATQEALRAAALAKYDEDLFQTGRLVTCGLYVNIILRDYVRTILNVNRSDTAWALDPRIKDGQNIFSKPTPEATGNQVSVEFNFLYRWHSAISVRDHEWTNDAFKEILGTDDPEAMKFEEFLGKLHSFEAALDDDPVKRQFHKIKRKEDGSLPDDDLVKVWFESVEDVAGSFGANRVPPVLKHVEILGIIQARQWNVATLNEFREFFGLTRHRTFEDINPDPEVATKLRNLYDSPDSVELYPGLVIEKAKPPIDPGSGLCVNFTTSRAILSDAVALVRGDRFYTVDYTPKHLTNWGFNEASYDAKVNNSHVIYKLVFRAFPNHFRRDSIYAHFPFTVPSENAKFLAKIHKDHLYSWDRPSPVGDLILVRSYDTVKKVLGNQKDYTVVWGDAIRFLTEKDGHAPGATFCLAGDKRANAESRDLVLDALYGPEAWESEVSRFYSKMVPVLLKKYSYTWETASEVEKKKPGTHAREVDIVRDVINLANTRLCAALFNLPIKIEENPWGVLTEQELYLAATAIFSSIFFDSDIAKSSQVRNVAKELAGQLERLVIVAAHAVDKVGIVTDAVESVRGYWRGEGFPAIAGYGHELIRHLLEKDKSVEECVRGTILPFISSNVPNQSALLAQCLDFYLEEENKHHLEELYRLAHENTDEADLKITKYMLEGSRIRGTVAVYRDVQTATSLPDSVPAIPNPSDPTHVNPLTPPSQTQFHLPLRKGDRLLLSLASASRDPTIFPEPDKVKLDRPISSYIHFGSGPHKCAGMELSIVAQTALFKQIVGLKNLRRAEGDRGHMKSMPARKWKGQVKGKREREAEEGAWTGLRVYMLADQSGYWPVPTTMKVEWDE